MITKTLVSVYYTTGLIFIDIYILYNDKMEVIALQGNHETLRLYTRDIQRFPTALYSKAFVYHGDKENSVESEGMENPMFPTLSEDLEWEMAVGTAETSKRGQTVSVRV